MKAYTGVKNVKIEVDFKFIDDGLKQYGFGAPEHSTPGSAAVDLRAAFLKEQVTVRSGGVERFRTGIAMHIADPGYAAIIIPRSGMGFTHGIGLRNQVGLIDSDYQGEIQVSLFNRGPADFVINPYDRIAQMLFVPVYQVLWNEVSEFGDSDRGTGGFGSTGTG